MPARHYDVIILGRGIGALLSAAILSRRELRVLLLGQGQLGSRYSVDDHQLCRRSFSLLSATSPAFRRALRELAQTQKFKHLTVPQNPMFALLDEDIRFDVPADVEAFGLEVDREFSEIKRLIAELYAEISTVNAQLDSAFERDVMWPPGNLLERLETGRVASQLPHLGDSSASSRILQHLPEGHRFRQVVELSALFSSHLGITPDAVDPLSTARLHGSWTRGVHQLAGGEADLEDFLLARIQAHGGVVRLRGRAEEVVTKRGKVVGVIEDGEESLTATNHLITDLTGEMLAELSGGAGVSRKAKEAWPHVQTVGGRFVVSAIVDKKGIPRPLPHQSFLSSPGPSLPNISLQRFEESTFGRSKPVALKPVQDNCVLVAEMLLPQSGGVHVLGAREAVLSTLRHYLPFLDEHLRLLDSPHDGLPVYRYEKDESGKNQRREIDRVFLSDVSALPEPMQARLLISPMGYLGLAGEPSRGPILGTFLVGQSVLPGFGQEGEVLAAWSACRIVTRKDRTRQKRRRQLWSKIETG